MCVVSVCVYVYVCVCVCEDECREAAKDVVFWRVEEEEAMPWD